MRAVAIEARIVRAADLYAYAAGDLDDAFRLGVLNRNDLPPLVRKRLGVNGDIVRERLVEHTIAASDEREIKLDDESAVALEQLRALLYERFYEAEPTAIQTRLAQRVLCRLWSAFRESLPKMLDAVGWQHRSAFDERPTMRDALDAIACMTDRFALSLVARC